LYVVGIGDMCFYGFYFLFRKEPALFGKIGTKMENVARDFTAEVPTSITASATFSH